MIIKLERYRRYKENVKDNNTTNNTNSNTINNKALRHTIPPKLDDIKQYIKNNNYDVNADKWFDFYTGKGWYVGKNKMKDWQAAIRTWLPDKPQQKLTSEQSTAKDIDYIKNKLGYKKTKYFVINDKGTKRIM